MTKCELCDGEGVLLVVGASGQKTWVVCRAPNCVDGKLLPDGDTPRVFAMPRWRDPGELLW